MNIPCKHQYHALATAARAGEGVRGPSTGRSRTEQKIVGTNRQVTAITNLARGGCNVQTR